MILDGRIVAEKIKAELAVKAQRFLNQHLRKPGLAVVLVGDDPASHVYVRNKVKACADTGFESIEKRLPGNISPAALKAQIRDLNEDPTVDAMLVQLPLPEGFDKDDILATIDPRKDADGLLAPNLGRLVLKQPGPKPCTPFGVMRILEHFQISLKGAEAVVVGRSQIVGLPMALMLQQADCTVTLCHSGTRDLKFHTKRADLVVVAAGKAKLLGEGYFKSDAVIVDVGIHRLGRNAGGKETLCGDVDFEAVKDKVRAITPVPGGVGPMTIAMLLGNTLACAEAHGR